MAQDKQSRNRKKKPLHTFRVYPEGTFHYAEVLVWPDQESMLKNGYRTEEIADSNVEGYCVPTRKWKVSANGKCRKTGVFAQVNFFVGCLGMEVVTHEFTHAMFCWADRRELDLSKIPIQSGGWNDTGTLPVDGVEERCCYALGKMAKQFVQKATKAGLYK